jgi:hypothetical protein
VRGIDVRQARDSAGQSLRTALALGVKTLMARLRRRDVPGHPITQQWSD